MDQLFALLELQRRIFEAPSREMLLHLVLNDSKRILPYSHAIFFSQDGLFLTAKKISGNLTLDTQSEFITQRTSLVKNAITSGQNVSLLSKDGIEAAVLSLSTDHEKDLGVIFLEFDRSVHDAEKIILDEMASVFAQAFALWRRREVNKNNFMSFLKGKKRLFIALILLIFFFPVRLNISAPAEIVAKDSSVVTAPFDGVLESIKFEAGDVVQKGDIIAEMEKQTLETQAELADQALRVAQAGLLRTQREVLRDPQKNQNLIELQELVRTKKIERDFAASLMARSQIKAMRKGVLMIDDIQSLRGKPVRTGDRLMMIADPADYQLLIRVPVQTMLPIDIGAKVRFFLNVNPLSSRSALINNVGYQATPDSDGLLTYKIIADISSIDPDLRVGWNGTARIKGDWTILGYSILRRPLLTLRNVTGF